MSGCQIQMVQMGLGRVISTLTQRVSGRMNFLTATRTALGLNFFYTNSQRSSASASISFHRRAWPSALTAWQTA